MNSKERLAAFCRLGNLLKIVIPPENRCISDNIIVPSHEEQKALDELQLAVSASIHHNPWFTPTGIYQAIEGLNVLLETVILSNWANFYNIPDKAQSKRVGVVMAGNIPAVGFHDFLCVLISGNIFVGKLSGADMFLIPAIAQLLVAIDGRFSPYIFFTTERLSGFDYVIATGSTNTSRYFNYYFGKYPNIIRSNRNSIAVLSGNETTEELQLLATDVFSYFGLGCRNVSLLFVPGGYNFEKMLEIFTHNPELINHSKYFNNYEYNKAILLINAISHYDNGTVLLKEDESISSSVSVLHYKFYNNVDEVNQWIDSNGERIQCVVSGSKKVCHSIPYGQSQTPIVSDYADGVDTMKFLLSL